jgi:hypothetical protein
MAGNRTGPKTNNAPPVDLNTGEGAAQVTFAGASVAQIAALFERTPKTIQEKIAANGIPPVGRRKNGNVYKIKDVAPYLVKPAGDIEEHIKRMHHNDLPPLLQKEFWNGLRARQSYEREQGELIPLADFQAIMGDVFKTLRQSLLLMGDAVEDQVSLSERQREIVKERIDAALEEVRVSLLVKFNAPEPDDEDDTDPNAFEGVFDDLDEEL